jgi:hypothetical protein
MLQLQRRLPERAALEQRARPLTQLGNRWHLTESGIAVRWREKCCSIARRW